MKEIKLRAWNKKEKRILQVHSIFFTQKIVRCHNAFAEKGDREYGCFFSWPFMDTSLVAQKYGTAQPKNEIVTILMQYIGVTDATKWERLTPKEKQQWLKKHKEKEWNGKEIYEGDIIVYPHPWDKVPFYFVVEWSSVREIGWMQKSIKHKSEKLIDAEYIHRVGEVVGNIYENPKLIIS